MRPYRVLLSLAVLVPFLALPSGTKAAGATRGVTDGEPETAEAHCCGMKGLGGAKVEVMCHPDTVAMGKTFTVNVNFTSDVKRPVDVHVDVLNAQTKAFYAGKWEEFDTQAGAASLTIKMPEWGVTEPFLWKVFVTPRGEPFPNMLAETGFVAHLADYVKNDCQSFKSYGFNPPEMKDNDKTVDFVILKHVPAELIPGTTATVEVEYNMVGAKKASISASLMRKGPNTQISSTGDAAKPGQNTMKLMLPVPGDAPREAVYIVVTLTPEGASWEDRLAEDRTYQTKMAGMRMRRE